MLILLLALALWPMASFGALDCCPEAGVVEEAANVAPHAQAHHGQHVAHHQASADEAGSPAPVMADCHESGTSPVPTSHATCDAECAARCATPSLLMSLAIWPAQVHAHPPSDRWHASVPPRPQGARLLRPPIHA